MSHNNSIQVASRNHGSLIKPQPRIEINIRQAIDDKADFRFIDDLQKANVKKLGFMYRQALENYIKRGDVLIAETMPPFGSDGKPIPGVRGTPLGYCISRDKYFKREDVGVVYQLAVKETKRRSLIGAMLVQATLEHAAYGCKLFCCWCAQDLDANHFWESIGFVPLAFRTGSEKSSRIHIFWQKRIREGDTDTPYWFPSQTSGGAIGEDRLVIPIPPGTHWSDAKPMVIPGVDRFVAGDEPLALVSGQNRLLPHPRNSRGSSEEGESKPKRRSKRKPKLTAKQKQASSSGGLWFVPPPEVSSPPPEGESKESKAKRKEKGPPRKYHPKYVEAARELCARFLDGVNDQGLLPEGWNQGKYDVSRPRTLEGNFTVQPEDSRLLDAA